MTREEAIAYGKRVIDLGLNDETQAFCNLAISALSAIEDIKAEIDDEWANTHHMYPEYASGLACASEIIDKHTEKETEEITVLDTLNHTIENVRIKE